MVHKFNGCRSMSVLILLISCFNVVASSSIAAAFQCLSPWFILGVATCNFNVAACQCLCSQLICLHATTCGSMSRHSSDFLPSPCLFIAPKCLFFIIISTKCVERGNVTNLHQKLKNECIRYAQMLCNFTPNKKY